MKRRFWLVVLAVCACCSALFSQTWEHLGGGTNGTVTNLTVDVNNDYLYASGLFTEAGSLDCNCIARWDGQNWDSLAGGGLGCPGFRVFKMTIFQDRLFAYGSLHNSAELELSSWDGSSWIKITTSDGSIEELFIYGDTLYITGQFETINGINSPRIIKYDGANFHPVDPDIPFDHSIASVEIYQDELYVGGSFSSEDSTLHDLAKWTGSDWVNVGEAEFLGPFTGISDMVVYNGELVVAGLFTASEGAPGNSIGAWNGQSWRSFGTGLGGVTNPKVEELEVHNGKLYAVGIFRTADNAAVRSIAVWDGSKWCGFEGDIEGSVASIAFYDNALVIAGSTLGNIGNGGTELNNIAFLEAFDTKEDSCSWPLGEQPIMNETRITLSPNPVYDHQTLTITKLESKDVEVQIMDMSGRVLDVLYRGEIRETLTLEVQCSSLDPGVYFYSINPSDGERLLRKTVISR